MGDESQDADGGGLGMDWEDQWFDDFEEGDELDPEPTARSGRVVADVTCGSSTPPAGRC